MKKLFALLVIASLGLFTIGCGDTKPAPAKKPADAGKTDPAKKPDGDKMEGKTDPAEPAKTDPADPAKPEEPAKP